LILTFEGDQRGHIAIHGEAQDRAGTGNHLRFALAPIDQTMLPDLLRQLAEILAAFPTRSKPAV
jgi:hypothetical protein